MPLPATINGGDNPPLPAPSEGAPLGEPQMVEAGFMWPPPLRGHSSAAPHNTHTCARLTEIPNELKVLPNRSGPTLKPIVAAGLACTCSACWSSQPRAYLRSVKPSSFDVRVNLKLLAGPCCALPRCFKDSSTNFRESRSLWSFHRCRC